MLKYEKFEPWHLERFDITSAAASVLEAFAFSHWKYFMLDMQSVSEILSITDGERFFAFVGYTPLWTAPGCGTCRVFVVPANGCEAQGRPLLRLLRSLLLKVEMSGMFNRLEVVVPSWNKAGIRLAEFLGFRLEGKLHRFDKLDTTYYMMWKSPGCIYDDKQAGR